MVRQQRNVQTRAGNHLLAEDRSRIDFNQYEASCALVAAKLNGCRAAVSHDLKQPEAELGDLGLITNFLQAAVASMQRPLAQLPLGSPAATLARTVDVCRNGKHFAVAPRNDLLGQRHEALLEETGENSLQVRCGIRPLELNEFGLEPAPVMSEGGLDVTGRWHVCDRNIDIAAVLDYMKAWMRNAVLPGRLIQFAFVDNSLENGVTRADETVSFLQQFLVRNLLPHFLI